MADEEIKQETAEEAKQVDEAIVSVEEPKQEELTLAAEETPKPEVNAEAEPEKPKTDWRDIEIKKKHAQIQEFKRQLAEKEAELEATKAIRPRDAEGKFVPVQQQQSDVVPVSEVQKEAQKLLAKQRYDEDCNKTAQAGQERYKGEWREAIANLETLGGFDPDTMTGLLATDDPAKVLFELGKNPEHYHRIMDLPVPRRIIEMGKLAMTPEGKKVSEAPPPVAPIGGRAAPAARTLDDTQPDDQWYQIRLAQKRKRWEEKNGVRR